MEKGRRASESGRGAQMRRAGNAVAANRIAFEDAIFQIEALTGVENPRLCALIVEAAQRYDMPASGLANEVLSFIREGAHPHGIACAGDLTAWIEAHRSAARVAAPHEPQTARKGPGASPWRIQRALLRAWRWLFS